MNVLRLHAPGDLCLHDEPVPAPALEETLVHVKAVGICGSDLHWFGEGGIGDAKLDRRLMLQHEFVGVTEAGERVAVDPAIPCRDCELREQMAWKGNCLFPIPDSFTYADAAMLEPLGVAPHAVDLGKLRAGMTVGVFGCGPIGLLIVQVVRLAGVMKHTDPRAMDVVSRGLLDVRSLVTHRFPLQEAHEAFRVAERREGLKVIIEM